MKPYKINYINSRNVFRVTVYACSNSIAVRLADHIEKHKNCVEQIGFYLNSVDIYVKAKSSDSTDLQHCIDQFQI